MRIAFLVDPSPDSMPDSIEKVDQIIDYNRGLWGGRFNPIILTDGDTIESKWWEFLREIDPDIIKPLVPLSIGIIEKFEKFLSPLTIEKFREDTQSNLGTWMIKAGIAPARIAPNSPNIYEDSILFGEPVLGTFDVDEMDDEFGKLFLLRNFGTYQRKNMIHHSGFSIPVSLGDVLSQGVVPPEIYEEFEKSGIPFSDAVFSKNLLQRPERWVLLDKENKQRHYVQHINGKLLVSPKTRSFSAEFDEVKKEVFLVTDRSSLADTLLKLADPQNIVYRDQVCAFPNTEQEHPETWQDRFEVVVGDTLQDIVYFWNRPWLLGRWRRKYMNQLWLPTALANDPAMEDALCSWINRNSRIERGNSETVQFVSFSTEEALKSIVSRFQKQLRGATSVKCYKEPQIPNLCPEDLLFFLRENPRPSRDSSIEIRKAQGNKDILELTEPNGLAQHDSTGHWMADFYIEFTHDADKNQEDVIEQMDRNSGFWQLPNRNHLTYNMFNRFSRIRQNGFPSALMRRGEKVVKLTLKNSESVVKSLFCSDNRVVYKDNDARVQVTTVPYYRSDISDKGKYLQGVLELFGNLTFAYEVFRNPYWRTMFDILSKSTLAEQSAEESIINKLKKLIDRSEPLTSANQRAIESLAAQIMNLAKNLTLTLKQKEFPFDAFMKESKTWQEKFIEDVKSTGNYSEGDLDALSRLTQRNIIQIGVKPQCPNCGMANWYHVDDISQQLTCQGCRVPFPLKPELTWQYRLNSLVHAAYALHGTTPVILVLGQLLAESKTSFLFSPNLNLLAAPQDELSQELETVAEVDIACIQDGKFIIGEVKQSMKLFREKDFDDMAKIAEKTKPDIVLFSCIASQQPTTFITNHIERIQSELRPLEIDVQWYQLESLDYSDRV